MSALNDQTNENKKVIIESENNPQKVLMLYLPAIIFNVALGLFLMIFGIAGERVAIEMVGYRNAPMFQIFVALMGFVMIVVGTLIPVLGISQTKKCNIKVYEKGISGNALKPAMIGMPGGVSDCVPFELLYTEILGVEATKSWIKIHAVNNIDYQCRASNAQEVGAEIQKRLVSKVH